MNTKLATLLLLAASAGACVDDPALGGELEHLGPGGGSHEQGRYYLGSIADGLAGPSGSAYLAASGTASSIGTLSVVSFPGRGSCLRVTVGGTVHECADAVFTGAVIQGPSGARPRFRILASADLVTAGLPGHTVTGYQLEHNASWPSTAAPSWEPYCEGDRLAFPIASLIARADGTFYPSTTAISFACSEYDATGIKPTALVDLVDNGVAAKAMSWGYVPGAGGLDWLGNPVSGVSLHQGAVTVGRAAYCGDGVSHTLDATSIQIFDLVNGNLALDGLPSEATPVSAMPVTSYSTDYWFEAVWGFDDVLVDGLATFEWYPICLSRLRWQSLPVGTLCTGARELIDPRQSKDAKFCDDYTLAELVAKGALLANFSRRNDAGLWRWYNPATADHLTTSAGGLGLTPATSILPATGYAAPELQGTLLTAAGKAVYEANYPTAISALVEIKSCYQAATGDTVTGRVGWLTANGFLNATCKSEGYVFTSPPSTSVLDELGWTMVQLKTWRKGSEYVTATTAPATYTTLVAAPGWIVAPAAW